MKRVIGLIPLVDEERDSLWMLPGYMDGVAAAGFTGGVAAGAASSAVQAPSRRQRMKEVARFISRAGRAVPRLRA